MRNSIYLLFALVTAGILMTHFSEILGRNSIFSSPPQQLIRYEPDCWSSDCSNGVLCSSTYSPCAEKNDDYSVQVSKNLPIPNWQDLFEYKTYVNNGASSDLENNQEASTFVNFDFTGTVHLKVTCNYCIQTDNLIESVLVRPMSKGITANISNDSTYVELTLTEPANLSLEINNDRHRNVHILSSKPFDEKSLPTNYVTVKNMYENMIFPLNDDGTLSKIGIYKPAKDETIYIHGDSIFRGMILIDGTNIDRSGVRIVGRGIIDHWDFAKNYSNDSMHWPANYKHRNGIKVKSETDVNIDGIIINDTQNNAINLAITDSVNINNVKVFTRVKWGAGVYMEASKDNNITNSFLRTSEDCITIYADRQTNGNWNRGDATNIVVENTALYADVARPMNIGVHGSADVNDKSLVENIYFRDIDILEHDEQNSEFWGAISIQCGDFNYCQNIEFNNINIEEFTEGSLLRIIVEKLQNVDTKTDGYRVQNILLNNIKYTRPSDPTKEHDSEIKGIDIVPCRYVNGVHFQDLIINGDTITDSNPYDKFDIGLVNTYDVTFNRNLNYTSGDFDGLYYIMNLEDNKYLNPTREDISGNNQYRTITASWPTLWDIEYVDNGNYKIVNNFYNEILRSSNDPDWNSSTGQCHGEFVYTEIEPSVLQDYHLWKIVDLGNSYRIINNWWGHSTLSESSLSYITNNNFNYSTTLPWEEVANQKWLISSPGFGPSQSSTVDLFPVPNRSDAFFEIDFSGYPAGNYSLTIYDLYANTLLEQKVSAEKVKVVTEHLTDGLYILHINDGNVVHKKQLIVEHK